MAEVEGTPVRLVVVDDEVLARLVHAATTDATADEVTAPVTPGKEWTAARVDWLRNFHRDRRAGLSGPMGEATWAIDVGGAVEGSVRLKRSDDPATFEMGIWLTGHSRGHGIGMDAVRLLLDLAATEGADVVTANTRPGNTAALAILDRLGFTTSPTSDGLAVEARRSAAQAG